MPEVRCGPTIFQIILCNLRANNFIRIFFDFGQGNWPIVASTMELSGVITLGDQDSMCGQKKYIHLMVLKKTYNKSDAARTQSLA